MMITIFNGSKRTLDQEPQQDVWAQVSVQFRDYLNLFKGAKLAVFLAIALHADKNGWAWPSIACLAKETGYDDDTIGKALAALCHEVVNGRRVLLKGQPRDVGGKYKNNTYLIFPSEAEIQQFSPSPGFPGTENPAPENPELTITNKNQNQSTLPSAALMYVEVFSKTPNSKQLVALEKVDDLERWKGLLDEWKLNGWNPNIGSMLDRYRNGKKPKTTGKKRKGKASRIPQVADSTEEEREAARLKAQQRIAARRAKGFVPLEQR